MKGFLTVLAMAGCACVGLWFYRDSARRMAVTTAPPESRVPAVEVIHLAKTTIEDETELVGGLEARSDVEIRTALSAYIARLRAEAGDFVQKGQLLVELDDSKAEESVSHAEAALHVNKAQLQAQKTRLGQAEKDYQRQVDLSRRGVSTSQQLEDAQAQMRIAKAEVELEEARVNQTEADLLHARLALNDTRIVAPMAGFVAEREADVGELSKPDVVLMRIVDISTVKTVVHIVEHDYPKVVPGQDASLTVDAYPDRRFTGKVVRKAPVLDPLTRTGEVFIEIANPEKLLKPGMHARVRLVFDRHKEAKVLPVAALFDDGKRRAVFVLDGSPPRARLRRVRTGYADGDIVEIISGLDAGDRIVVSGGQFLKEGSTVAAVEKEAPALASAEILARKPTPSKGRR